MQRLDSGIHPLLADFATLLIGQLREGKGDGD